MNHLRGPFFALLAAILFGISPPLAKRLIGEINPHLLAGLLYLGSGVGLATVMALRRFAPASGPPLKRIARNEWGWLVGAIAFGGVVAPVLLMRGLSGTAATTASLLLNFEAVFTAVLAWLLFREGVNRRVLVGFLSILVGGLTVSWTAGAGLSLSSAALLIVAACACWGIDNNLTRKVSHADALLTATLKGLTAGLVNVLLALGAGARWPAMAETGSALAPWICILWTKPGLLYRRNEARRGGPDGGVLCNRSVYRRLSCRTLFSGTRRTQYMGGRSFDADRRLVTFNGIATRAGGGDEICALII